ncbi:dihydroorotate dehydrogenase (quinone), partial [Dehalococcoidia bacterium]|nr:dihydroorotate dehydrogenase (quinone) [Dehalococcoidia bacterium]
RDAWALLRAGANVVQLYTGLVYKGPLVVKSIKKGLISMLEAAEIPSVKLVAGYKPPS